MHDVAISDVAHVIQLSVAPVFLLSGIGAMLAVMTHRLARVMDRARALEALQQEVQAGRREPLKDLQERLSRLGRRAVLVSRAILLCTVTALLVCSVIVVLFVGAWFGISTALPVSVLFVGAMLMFILGLLTFLREVFLALAGLKLGSP